MISLTKMLCDVATSGDALRYGIAEKGESQPTGTPVVVWNMSRRCNLRCVHCYAEASMSASDDELTTDEAKALIDDLAEMRAPVLLFSGGEPTMRPDLIELGAYTAETGVRPVISTNGTLIDVEMAGKIKDAGFQYVGVSIDGLRETNDRFRGKRGAFDAALDGLRNCRDAGLKVGIRFTVNKRNYDDLPGILDLLEEEKIPRFCLYHLVYAGRGSELANEDLAHVETRAMMDMLFERTVDFHERGIELEMLTVDNHADGVYLYLKLARENPDRAREVLRLLRISGGNASGVRIGCVGVTGEVHADQFWRHYSFGNVRRRKFSEIWYDLSDELMAGLKDRRALLTGKCGRCSYQDICNGNFRVRAEAVHSDPWMEDPACYLTEEEIVADAESLADAAPGTGQYACKGQ